MEDLRGVPGIGDITAPAVHEYFRSHTQMLDRLLKHVELLLPKTGKLSGKSFVFSGSFDDGKSYWEKRVQDLGGKTGDSVKKDTTYLVAGPGSGSKSDKAKEHGVTIIDIDKLKAML